MLIASFYLLLLINVYMNLRTVVECESFVTRLHLTFNVYGIRCGSWNCQGGNQGATTKKLRYSFLLLQAGSFIRSNSLHTTISSILHY